MRRALMFPLLLPLLASAALVSSCKSGETYESGQATGKTIQQAADEVDRTNASLDATVKSMNSLVEKPAIDPKPQFKAFSSELEALESRAKSVRDLATSMDANSKAYFAKWDAQIAEISNEDIRNRSQERRQKVDESFAKIREQYAKAREDFKPLLADLKDIRTALAADLTPNGIDAVKKTAGKVANRADDVKKSLAELSEQYRKLGVGLGNLPPPTPPKQ
jgi:chromosome segregation ATPase